MLMIHMSLVVAPGACTLQPTSGRPRVWLVTGVGCGPGPPLPTPSSRMTIGIFGLTGPKLGGSTSMMGIPLLPLLPLLGGTLICGMLMIGMLTMPLPPPAVAYEVEMVIAANATSASLVRVVVIWHSSLWSGH